MPKKSMSTTSGATMKNNIARSTAGFLFMGTKSMHQTCTAHQAIQWNSTETKPTEAGDFLCAVETDDGCQTHTLHWDGANWIHEGEPTFCKSWMFRPYAWAKAIEAPPRELFPE